MQKAELAYTAGIIDGEGYIGCWYDRDGYRRRLTVHMKYDKVPNWLHKTWGGTIHDRNDNTFSWYLEATKGKFLLEQILPYMVEKKDQAILWLKMAKLQEKNILFQKDSDKLAEAKQKVYVELKSLHN